MRTLMSLAIGSSLFVTSAGSLQAGTVVKQTMESKVGSRVVATHHVWSIDGGKFHLAVTEGDAEKQYVFNGRTLYVCGKLDDAQLKAAGSDEQLLKPYRAGACQVVPSNFMLRFFVSPQLAVESVDASDGLKLTLAVDDYKTKATPGKPGQSAGHKCSKAERRYDVTKSSGAASIKADVTESLCFLDGVDWRSHLAKEVGKTVLRQPGGARMIKTLKLDHGTVGGLVLETRIQQTVTARDGKSEDGSYQLTTKSVATVDIPASTFKLPSGYKLFSPEGMDLAKVARPKAPAGATKEDSVVDLFQSVFFCAIAGRLGCF